MFSLYLAIGFTSFVSAQPKGKIEHYSTEDGLSHGIVTFMHKDKEGFMWFGTWNGINRFDGHRFITYKSSPGDLSYLRTHRIDQIVEDDYLHLWIQAYDGQVYRFDKRTEQLYPLAAMLKMPPKSKYSFNKILSASRGKLWIETAAEGLICVESTKSDTSAHTFYNQSSAEAFSLPSNKINFFKEDAHGLIWVGTTKGLACFSAGKDGIYRRKNIGNLAGSGSVSSIAITNKGDSICVGTADGQVTVLNTSTGKTSLLQQSGGKINTLYFNKSQNSLWATTATGQLLKWDLKTAVAQTFIYKDNTSIHSIFEDKAGNIWIEPSKLGVIKFDISTSAFKTYTQEINRGGSPAAGYFKIFEDNAGRVWVSLKGGGFGYYEPSTDNVEYFYNKPGTAARRFSNIVGLLFYDPAGILWMRTDERGIEKVTFPKNEFKQNLLVNNAFFQSENEVRGVFQDKKGKLWIGGKGGRLYVYENGKELNNIFVNTGIDSVGAVYTMMQDRNDAIWLGTKAHGLYKAVPVNTEQTKYKLYHFEHNPNDASGIGTNEIYSLLEDKYGRIWIGSFDQGLIMAVQQGEQVSFIHDKAQLNKYPKSLYRKIRHFALDAIGNLWIATTDGLLVMSIDKSAPFSYMGYQKIPGDNQSLGNNDVQYVFRDSQNNMWMATSGGGLSLAMGTNPLKALKFQVYTTKDGLANDYLLSCQEDNNHKLWIATQTGLAEFDLINRTFRNYNSYDGLPNIAFSEASSIRLQNGDILLGTLKGFLSFSPAKIKDHPIASTIAFTNLQINNTDVTPGEKDNILTYSIDQSSSIKLKYNQNIISIDYGVLDFRSSDKQFYSYRLAGFDTGWQNNTSERRVTYTNLPPGNYTFEVKCVSSELYSNVPYKSLKITILPPPWKTWWAYTLYVLAAVIFFVFVRRTEMTMLRLKNKVAVEKELAELKMNFFTNVSHELRTPMTLIVNPIEEIAKQEKLSERGRQYIEVVRKNADRMVRFINQLLDLRKVQSGKATLSISEIELGSFVARTGGYFDEVMREKKIDFRINKNTEEILAWLDAEKVETVIYNLLANACKFSPAEKIIEVTIKDLPETNTVSIDVSDQAGGVSPGKLQQIFELFYHDDKDEVKHGKGTGIGLALCKELVHLHGGSISAANNDVGGLTVTLLLPKNASQQSGAIINESLLYNSILQTQQSLSAAEPVIEETIAIADSTNHNKPLILLVEDNADLQFYLKSQLSNLYRIELAVNGQAGLAKAKELAPDLILSDVMMPVMSGIEMLDKLKNDTATSHIPVILLTAKSAVESQIEALQYGADYYITKPFHEEFLVAAINNLLAKRKKILESLLDGKKTIQLEPGEVLVTSQDEIFLQKVLKVVEEKMEDPEFNIDTVAELMAMGRTTFYRKLKSLTDMAPVEFVREIRLKKAKQYLDAGHGNISEIAYMVGFNNPKYFSTCFKTKFNILPSDYLKQKGQSSS